MTSAPACRWTSGAAPFRPLYEKLSAVQVQLRDVMRQALRLERQLDRLLDDVDDSAEEPGG